MRFHNLPAKKTTRRERRTHLTPGERYILDFYCPSEKLAVELDGSTHDHEVAQNYDSKRNAFLKGLGIRTLRFENEEIRKNMEGVLTAIEAGFERA
jgi:very-short-patch-repair endonuclease